VGRQIEPGVLRGRYKYPEPWKLETYRKIGGYEAWEKILAEKTPRETIIETVKASGLRGRGGAGFPTGVKWSFMPRTAPGRSTPCATRTSPSPAPATTATSCATTRTQLIEGMAIGGYAMGATVGYNYIRGEFLGEPVPRFEAALKEACRGACWARTSRLGRRLRHPLTRFVGAGAYICGEETALLESLEGKQGKPRFKPPFPAFGLYGKPDHDQQHAELRLRAHDPAQGRGLVRGPRQAEQRRHR
jgi:NADH-quinone oxidoreductase subunit F